MSFVQNFPFFSIIIAMFSGIVSSVLDGKKARNLSLGMIAVTTALSAGTLIFCLGTGESYTFMMGHFPAPWGNEIRAGILEGVTAVFFGVVMFLAVIGGLKHTAEDVEEKYGVELRSFAAIGFSGMMHGYMAFDKAGELLVPFRTWRNTMTEEACGKLTELFGFNIPQRWSIAHLYQAILGGEEHVKDIDYLTTLAGYIHWKLSGERVLGVGEASGMFPIDSDVCDFDGRMVEQFDGLVARTGCGWKLKDILPRVLGAGERAGVLTPEGARLLDPTGRLQPGVPMCPPEGDAGTGMTATNSVRVRTGNISAGTSIFSMVVTEKALSKVHEEIDMVTTPDGKPVAMVHCNNCTSDLNAWVNLFEEFGGKFGLKPDRNELFGTLYREALSGDADCGGLMAYNYFSGEPVTGLNEGRPLFVRTPDARFTLANFMRSHLYSSMAALKIGNDILMKEEQVKVDSLTGHGGLFKTPVVGQQLMAAAMNAPVTVMDTASEGGAWGMAVLACYMWEKENGETLPDYLSKKIFAGQTGTTIEPKAEDVAGFDKFIEKYKNTLPAEKAAVAGLV